MSNTDYGYKNLLIHNETLYQATQTAGETYNVGNLQEKLVVAYTNISADDRGHWLEGLDHDTRLKIQNLISDDPEKTIIKGGRQLNEALTNKMIRATTSRGKKSSGIKEFFLNFFDKIFGHSDKTKNLELMINSFIQESVTDLQEEVDSKNTYEEENNQFEAYYNNILN